MTAGSETIGTRNGPMILGVHRRVAMEVMGWSSESMAKRYQHVSDELRRDVAQQVNGLLWGNK